jgi:methylated-DNA-protein-cysteine methyltransferase-like protein
MDPDERAAAFYRAVRRVPRGRVTTYGQIALLAGCPGYARHVGHALAALRGTRQRVPWQRVLGKAARAWGRIAILDPVGAAVQRALLEREGVVVDRRGRVSLGEYGWPPPAPAPRRAVERRAVEARAQRPSPPAPTAPSRSRRRTRGSRGRS